MAATVTNAALLNLLYTGGRLFVVVQGHIVKLNIPGIFLSHINVAILSTLLPEGHHVPLFCLFFFIISSPTPTQSQLNTEWPAGLN
jgi:hypothetical protein